MRQWPNHALQRTAPRVTVAAILARARPPPALHLRSYRATLRRR